jgi:mRNA-degrading endonuclease RelE of RelBE toxin-antitoxin system
VEIVRTRQFVKDLKRIGATEADQTRLETEIKNRPEAGDLISGLRGLRKIRFTLQGRGKSSGGRAIYWVVTADVGGIIVMLTAYSKSEQIDLTPDQRKRLLKAMEDWDND